MNDAAPQTAAAASRTSPPKLSARSVALDVSGGLAGAVASLALALSLGLLAFSPLGPQRADVGVFAGFASAIYGQLIAGVLGGASHPGSGPRASASLVLAGLVARLAADPSIAAFTTEGAATVVALAGAAVVGAGVLQIAFGAIGAGTIARYVPYPFVAGFMCGAAALVILAQFTPLTGIDQAHFAHDPVGALANLRPGTLLLGVGTAAAIFAVASRTRRIPASLAGLVAGAAAYHLIAAIAPSIDLGPVVGRVPAGLPLPTALAPIAAAPDLLWQHFHEVASTALVLAVIATLDTLFAAVAIDHATDGRHDVRREMVAHGIANVAVGLCGGVPVVLSKARAMASWDAGGRTRLTVVVAAASLALALVAGSGALAIVPIAVLGGIMVTLGVALIDAWAEGIVRRLRRPEGRRDRTLRWSAATVLLVALTAIVEGFIAAMAVGFLMSGLLFFVGMNRSLVRSVVDGTARPSRRIWGAQDEASVAGARRRFRIVELEGALFFGSAERLSERVEPMAGTVDAVILDFRRVTAIDATGALLVERLARRLARRGTTLLLAHVTPKGRHGEAFVAHGAFRDPGARHWFPDTDHAVEWAERVALAATPRAAHDEVPLDAFPLFDGLDDAARARIGTLLERRAIGAHEVLFREGDPGDRLCLIAHGAIEISIDVGDGRRARIVTMAQGSLFGEAALLDGRPRSATATAVEPTIVLELSRDALDRLGRDAPDVAIRVMTNLARAMSLRMRETNEILRQLDDSRG